MTDAEPVPVTDVYPPTIAEALVKLQGDLPKVVKANPANYGKYADLADISDELLPRLSKYGLAWTCMPCFDEKDRWGLRFELLHVSGDSREGFWEIPTDQGPQKSGGGITYAKRYALCAVTGLAPDEDDDGQEAQQAHEDAQQTAAETEKLDKADTERAVAKGLVVEDEQALTDMIAYVERSTLGDRDVSHLVTAQDRERIPNADADTPFTLSTLLGLAKEYLQSEGHSLRGKPKEPAEEAPAES